jgi:hypothetical protein
VTVALLAVAFGCRPNPGPSRYDEQEPFPQMDGGTGSLPGPMPYVPGDRRLSIGAFYENDASDIVAVDNMNSNLYVYSETVTLLPDPDHIEGKASTRITDAGLTWWGFGVHWMMPRSLATWTKLHLSLRSADAAFTTINIGLNNANPIFLSATNYGWSPDDQWHTLTLPLADFVAAGLDLTQVAAPFVLSGETAAAGSHLLLDDVYFTAD